MSREFLVFITGCDKLFYRSALFFCLWVSFEIGETMSTKRFILSIGIGFSCFVLVIISYKLFEYHRQLRELLSIVQRDTGSGVVLGHNGPTTSVVQKIVGKSQIWRPVQESVKDSVVQIFVQAVAIDMLQPYKTPSQFSCRGTGFLINEDGEIVTNAHVVRNAKSLWIQIPSLGKRILDAEVVGECPDRDIALLRLTKESKEIIGKELGALSFLQLGNSDLVRRADEVMALGYPLGQQSLKSTTGVISGREGGLIQISAAINSGNSGGPLLNLNGEVIGINSSKQVGSTVDNVAYMIPINDLRVALSDLRKVKLLRKPYLGVLFNNASESLTSFLGNPLPGGCYVTEVIKGSTLYKAGIKSGDMIYEINGHAVDMYGEMNVVWSEDKISLINYVGRLSLGQDINLVVYRKSKRKEVSVQFSAAELPAIRQVYPWLEEIDYEVFAGMVVMQLTGNHIRGLASQAPGLMYYAEMKNQTEPALLITHIFQTSQLSRVRTLAVGMIINELNGIEVKTLADLRRAYKSGDKKCLTIRAMDHFSRATDNILVVLPYEKIMEQEPQLAQLYRYSLSDTAKELLGDHAQKLMGNNKGPFSV